MQGKVSGAGRVCVLELKCVLMNVFQLMEIHVAVHSRHAWFCTGLSHIKTKVFWKNNKPQNRSHDLEKLIICWPREAGLLCFVHTNHGFRLGPGLWWAEESQTVLMGEAWGLENPCNLERIVVDTAPPSVLNNTGAPHSDQILLPLPQPDLNHLHSA